MSNFYHIDNGIPIPNGLKAPSRTKYPLELLEIGQSFYVKLDDPRKAKNLRSSMQVRAKKLRIGILTLADETGVRVWRSR